MEVTGSLGWSTGGVLSLRPHRGISCRVVAQPLSRPQIAGIVQLADALGRGFSGTPFLSAATLMASGPRQLWS